MNQTKKAHELVPGDLFIQERTGYDIATGRDVPLPTQTREVIRVMDNGGERVSLQHRRYGSTDTDPRRLTGTLPLRDAEFMIVERRIVKGVAL